MRTKVLIYLTGLLVSVGLCAKAQTPVANKSYKQTGWFNINKSKMIEPPAGFKIQKTYKIANPIDMKSPKSPAVSDENSKVWGYCIYDENFRTYGLVNFNTDTPETIKLYKDYGHTNPGPMLLGGTMVKDKYMGVLIMSYDIGWTPIGYGYFHLDTGEFEVLSQYTDLKTIFTDMTYDSKNDIVYAVGWDDIHADKPVRVLYKIDNTTYEPIQIGTMDKYCVAMAADDKGTLYGIEYSGTDYKGSGKSGDLFIMHPDQVKSPSDLVPTTLVGNTGISASDVTQTMSFDFDNHKLYWTGCPDYTSTGFLAEVNPKTGKIKSTKPLQGNMQVSGMAIPYQLGIADGAPSYVRNLIVNPDDNMALKVSLSWTNPTITYQKEELKNLSSVKIYRDGTLMTTLTDVTPGQKMTWNDDNAPKGNVTYRLVTANADGEGLYREVTAYVGEDVPGKVQDVHLTAKEDVGTLTWSAPKEGKNGGAFSTASLSYDVTRMPDSVVVAKGLKTTSLTDKVTKVMGYYYRVVAQNETGKSDIATSNVVSFGPALDVPYEVTIDTQDNFNSLNVVDANQDGNTWGFFNNEAEYLYNPNSADDYLVSSFLKLKKDKPYKVSYIFHGNGDVQNIVESMDVVYGAQPDAEHLNNVLMSYPKIVGQDKVTAHTTLNVPADGNYVVGFHCNSAANQWFVAVNYLKVEEYMDNDLEAFEIKGPAKLSVGAASKYTVGIANAGKKAQTKAKVQIIDASSNVVGETEFNGTINQNDSAYVEVSTTPTEIATNTYYGKVVLDGDANANNDVTKDGLNVKVTENEGEWVEVNPGNNAYTTWVGPFFFSDDKKTSVMQSIYLASELKTTKKYINGVEYYYAPYEAGFDPVNVTDVPVQVYIMNTSESAFVEDGGFIGSLDKFTLCFDGTISTDQQQTPVTCMFSKAFQYTGGNICVMTVRPMDITSYNHFGYWKDFEATNRGYSYRSSTGEFDLATFTPSTSSGTWYRIYPGVPVASFAWLNQDPAGVTSINGDAALSATFDNGSININAMCDKVELFDISGRMIGQYNNTRTIKATDMVKGVYVIKMYDNEKTSTQKLFVK
jgi:hypothetical protein